MMQGQLNFTRCEKPEKFFKGKKHEAVSKRSLLWPTEPSDSKTLILTVKKKSREILHFGFCVVYPLLVMKTLLRNSLPSSRSLAKSVFLDLKPYPALRP